MSRVYEDGVQCAITQGDARSPLFLKPEMHSIRNVTCRKTVLQNIFPAAVLLGLMVLFYQPALHGGLLFDDDRHITPAALRSLHGLWRIWFELGAGFQYYPVLHSAMWMEYRLWGDAVTGYHWVNLLLHFGSACLVVAIMRQLKLPGAWLAAFLFTLHPVCVESVAWISEQKNTLSTLFYLAAALVYLRFDQKRRTPLYFLALGLFFLALLSKTVTATLPGALLVIFWWQRGRLDWKRDLLPLIPWFFLGAASGLLSGWMERRFYGAEGLDFSLTFPDRFLLAARVLWFYAGKLVWPANLMFHYPLWQISAKEGWQYLFPAGLLLLAATLCWIAKRNRGPLAAFLFFVGTLFPVLGFLNIEWFVFSYVADHFQYVACLGLMVPAAVGFTLAVQKIRIPAARVLVCVMAGVGILVLSSLTWNQCQMYRDMETFYHEILTRNPDCGMAHYNYGLVLIKVPGRLSDALFQFEEALRLRPDDAALQNGAGTVFFPVEGRQEEAIAAFEAALRIKPDYAEAHFNLAEALETVPGRQSESLRHYETALRLKPGWEAVRQKLNQLRQQPVIHLKE